MIGSPYSMHNALTLRSEVNVRELASETLSRHSDEPLSLWQRIDNAKARQLLRRVSHHMWPGDDRESVLALLDRLESHAEWVAAGRP